MKVNRPKSICGGEIVRVMKMCCCYVIIVGWQATQKYSFEYILKKMDFFFTNFLFGAQRLQPILSCSTEKVRNFCLAIKLP